MSTGQTSTNGLPFTLKDPRVDITLDDNDERTHCGGHLVMDTRKSLRVSLQVAEISESSRTS